MVKPTTNDNQPDREHLGPMGPAKLRSEKNKDKHVNPGNVTEGDVDIVGPTPGDDPDGEAGKLERIIDKKRAATPPD